MCVRGEVRWWGGGKRVLGGRVRSSPPCRGDTTGEEGKGCWGGGKIKRC